MNVFNPTNLNGVQVYVDDGTTPERLRALGDTSKLPAPHKTTAVMALSDVDDDELAPLVAAFEALLPYVDEYVLMYPGSGTPGVERDPDDEDPESDVPEGIPKVITSYVHLDVPYAFTRTWAGALKRAWRSVRPGDNLLVIGAQLNDVLAILVPVSQTVAPNSGQIAPPVPEQDEDPSQA
ncbi:MAG: hypothetical protein IT324_09000 [Anaerolineae bacterium]|nr:hypothetical protein [Anaerolineae bacterium]